MTTVDCDRHASVRDYTYLVEYMTNDWRRHFDREEWMGSVNLSSNHIRVSDDFWHEPEPEYVPDEQDDAYSLVLAHQGLTVSGWADRVAAKAYISALNAYGADHWTSEQSHLVALVDPYDVEWSTSEVRRLAGTERVGGVAIPLVSDMLGNNRWYPVYELCSDLDLPLVVHYSGVEGLYSGAPQLAGGVHTSGFSRLSLMPHIAESNVTSLIFEGVFRRYPNLRVIFTGFGFTWLPSLLWRMDREWRTFRHDIPWVLRPPSMDLLANMYFATYPIGEAKSLEEWQPFFTDELSACVVFGSHAPIDEDSVADVESAVGADWRARFMTNGAKALGLSGATV